MFDGDRLQLNSITLVQMPAMPVDENIMCYVNYPAEVLQQLTWNEVYAFFN